MRRLLPLVLAVLSIAPAAAEAGTYHVYACSVDGTAWGNRAWTGAPVSGFVVDTDCTPATALIGLRVDGGKAVPNGASAGLTFTSPPGTTIADFMIDRHLHFRSNPPLDGTRPLYAVWRLGGTVFAGAGDFHGATRDRLKAVGAWYGHPQANATLSRRKTTLREMGALAGYDGKARTLSIQVGCYRRQTNCSAPSGGRVFHVLYGVDVTVRDDVAPVPTVLAEGLLAGGPRNGSDPVVLSASDNAGIRRIELVDVTGAPRLVGAEDYTTTRTEKRATCSWRLAKPCPDLERELVRPSTLEAGARQLLVRTVDAAGNRVDRGPFPIDVATPADRGAVNGTGVSEPATLTARFAGRKRRTHTVRYGKRVRIKGRLRNAAGAPIAGAEVVLRTRNRRPGARTVRRKAVLTRADGTFRTRLRARASQRVVLGWRSHLNDVHDAARSELRLRTRAAATLRASTRSPALGARLVLRGRLRVPARGVTVIVQGRRVGGGRYTTFADTRTNRRGRFRVGYRFRDAASRGSAFRFRAKLRGGRGYPFATGHTRVVTVRVR